MKFKKNDYIDLACILGLAAYIGVPATLDCMNRNAIEPTNVGPEQGVYDSATHGLDLSDYGIQEVTPETPYCVDIEG